MRTVDENRLERRNVKLCNIVGHKTTNINMGTNKTLDGKHDLIILFFDIYMLKFGI